MKLKRIMTFSAVALMLNAGVARAVHVWEDPGEWANGVVTYGPSSTPLFTANELSLDMFGSYEAHEEKMDDLFKTNIRHGTWGGGVGLNYFITREIGIGGDINIGDNGGSFVDQALGSLILRWPFETIGLAPYIFGGGGRGFDPSWEWFGDLGVGVEYRINPAAGIFVDSRYMWHEKEGSSDRILFRAGLRLVF
jgi:hypothetical protein